MKEGDNIIDKGQHCKELIQRIRSDELRFNKKTVVDFGYTMKPVGYMIAHIYYKEVNLPIVGIGVSVIHPNDYAKNWNPHIGYTIAWHRANNAVFQPHLTYNVEDTYRYQVEQFIWRAKKYYKEHIIAVPHIEWVER